MPKEAFISLFRWLHTECVVHHLCVSRGSAIPKAGKLLVEVSVMIYAVFYQIKPKIPLYFGTKSRIFSRSHRISSLWRHLAMADYNSTCVVVSHRVMWLKPLQTCGVTARRNGTTATPTKSGLARTALMRLRVQHLLRFISTPSFLLDAHTIRYGMLF